MNEAEQYIESVVRPLLEHPEDVYMQSHADEKGVLITLEVNSGDLGRLIGKKGATIGAVRTLLKVLGSKAETHYSLKLDDKRR